MIADWVRPSGRSAADCLELARASVVEMLRGCLPMWEAPEVGLTGGWDSRAVAASLRALGPAPPVHVRGLPGRPDVTVADALARVAGLDLTVHEAGGLPAGDAAACRRSVALALLWQAGHAAAHRHKTFLAGRRRLKPRAVSVTGQHGELGRRDRAVFGDADAARRAGIVPGLTPAAYEARVLRALLADLPPFVRPGLRRAARQAIVEAYHRADRYGLTGTARVDFFCLHEFTRRKGAGVHAWQPRVVVAPFLHPGFIRAVFSHPARTDPNAFHRHIIAAHAPDWAAVPFAEDLPAAEPLAAPGWRQPTGRENYDGLLYWRTAGKPLIDEALARGGFWTDVFDPDAAASQWATSPDLLAMLYLLPAALGGELKI